MNSRLATPDDIAVCIVLRGQTREYAISAERLAAMGITEQSWADDVGPVPSPAMSASTVRR
jgi:hypothetical protein